LTKKDLEVKLAILSRQSQEMSAYNLNAVIALFISVLTNGDGIVKLPGLGTLERVMSKARKGTNPQTGKPINIPSKQKVVFRPSKVLKANLND